MDKVIQLKKVCCLRFCKMLLLFLPLVALVLFLQNVFYHADHNTERFHDFYLEPANSLDVVMMGASDMYAGFSSAYAYEYSGLTSYPFAGDSNPASLYLPQLREILAHQKPQAIVVEVHGFLYDDVKQHAEGSVRRFLESIPPSQNKLSALLRRSEQEGPLSLLPFFKYHGQWTLSLKELAEQYHNRPFAQREPSLLKGATTNTNVFLGMPRYDVSHDDTASPLAPEAQVYLREFLDYCQSHDVSNVLFLRIPRVMMNSDQYERYTRSNEVERIVTDCGFDFLDLEQHAEDVGIDPEYDFYNDEHLNIYGQAKLTEYLCDYLMDTYALSPMEQTEENRRRWDKSIEYFHAFTEAAEMRMEADLDDKLYENPQLLYELEQSME